MGYPSWGRLAEKCIEQARATKLPIDEAQFTRLMKKYDYPNVFKYLQAIITRPALVASSNHR